MATLVPRSPPLPTPALVVSDYDDEDNSSCSPSEEGDSPIKARHFEKNQGKDSGIDCGPEVVFVPPDKETVLKIRHAVEYYLSDANVLKDPFLLKHLRRNKEGYVSLKLIASFRKVRSLNRNWKCVAYSLRDSKLLALNAEGTKVRRLTPLPDHDETESSRTVIVYNLTNGKNVTVENVNEIFSKCGAIALVRILKPGGSQPPDIKRFLLKHPDVQSKECGLIEFEQFTGAKKALAMDTGLDNSVRVIPLVIKEVEKPKSSQDSKEPPSSPPKESPKKKKKNKRSHHGSKTNLTKCPDCECGTLSTNEQKNRRSSFGYSSSSSSGYLSSSPGDSRFPRRHSYNPSGHYSESSTSSFHSLSYRNNHRGSRDRINRGDSEKINESPGSQSPWRRRRETLLKTESGSSSFSSSSLKVLSVKTVRLPLGPDGTTGFRARTCAKLPSTAE